MVRKKAELRPLVAKLKTQVAKLQNRDNPPPPYKNSQPTEGAIDQAIKTWDTVQPADWERRTANLKFEFVPEIRQGPSIRRLFTPAWHAVMHVNARNMPLLMRDGFYWSEKNFVKSNERLILSDNSLPHRDGKGSSWKHTRKYGLTSLPGEPEWRALVYVYAKRRSVVLGFNLDRITMDTVVKVNAEGWCSGFTVYTAERRLGRPGIICNTLMGDMELDGWWPGPKKQGHRRPKKWEKCKVY